LTIIAAILIFCLLIISHEFGHFIMAKICGVYVYDFSLGMGPKLLSWKGKETQYTLRLFPIGGWVKMMGEDEDSDDPRSFIRKKISQRMAIIAAGPIMNFLTAILLFVIIFMMIGTYSTENIAEPIDGKPAQQAGMQNGDRIIEINGYQINEWSDITTVISDTAVDGSVVDTVVERDGKQVEIAIQPTYDQESGYWQIGVMPPVVRQNFFVAVKDGVVQTYVFTKLILVSLVQMVTGQIDADLAGPIGVVSIIGQATSYGIQSLLLLTAMLCVNLGIINLLPLPALDGCRIVFLAIEGIRGKPINREREGLVHFIGLILLFGLMIVITYNDIIRLLA